MTQTAMLAIMIWLACVMPGTPANTGDWPHIRGPNYDGRASSLPLELSWTEMAPPIVWRTQLGDGYSGIIVVNGRLYTQDQTQAGQFVVCLDLYNGAELWRTRYGWPWEIDGDWPGPYASPTYAEGRIYFAGCFGEVGCIDAQTGKMIWSVNLAKNLGLQMPGFGYATTPLVYNGKVYLTAAEKEGSVLSLNADNGSVIWQNGAGPASYSSCMLIYVKDHPQIVVVPENAVIGLDPETGRELWKQPLVAGYNPHAFWPLYQDPYLFYGLPFNQGSHVFRLSQTSDGSRSDVVWTSPVLSVDILSGVVVDGFIYAFDLHDAQTPPCGGSDGLLKCVELATGKELWASREPGHASILSCGDKLVMLNETGTLTIATLSQKGYHECNRWPLFPGSQCWTIPTICNGFLIARSRKDIVCLSLMDTMVGKSPAAIRPASEKGIRAAIHAWFARYRSSCFWAPSLIDQGIWYVCCTVGVLLPAWILAAFLAARPRLRVVVFLGVPVIFAIVGVWLFTTLLGRFCFTWPVVLFQAVFLAILCRDWARRKPSLYSAVMARLTLVGIALLAVAYGFLCGELFLVSGWGYLSGLIPLLLVIFPSAGPVLRGESLARQCVAQLGSFTVYFWCSALFIYWKTSR